MSEPSYPGAVPPERERFVEANGLRIRVVEWGDPQADPILLTHGMWDHARSFDVFAPLLARRYRVVAFDQRGHGNSSWAPAYAWLADMRDASHVLRSIGRPAHLVGHSKGGGLATDLSRLAGDAVRKLVNIDGFGPRPADYQPATPEKFKQYLEARRKMATRDSFRPYPSLDDLVERRRSQNPRLTREWLRYFVFHGANQSTDGWRWKSDPMMVLGIGPWQPDWITLGNGFVSVPMLAIVGSVPDTWGPLPEPLFRERIGRVKNVATQVIDGVGHFVHIEKPVETSEAVVEFLGRERSSG